MAVYKIPERKDGMTEVRCQYCRRLLFYGEVKRIEIKCPKCGRILEFAEDNKT